MLLEELSDHFIFLLQFGFELLQLSRIGVILPPDVGRIGLAFES